MLARAIRRAASLFSKIKVDEIQSKSYDELVDLVAKRYVIQATIREIDSSSTSMQLHFTKYSITSTSSHPEIGSSI